MGQFTNQPNDAKQYLALKNIAYKPRSKDPAQQDKYAIRIANKAFKDAQAGKQFDRYAARGKTKQKTGIPSVRPPAQPPKPKRISHEGSPYGPLPANAQGKHPTRALPRVVIHDPQRKADITRAYNLAGKPRNMWVAITGLVKYTLSGGYEAKGVTVSVTRQDLETAKQAAGNNMLELAYILTGREWKDVGSISIIYNPDSFGDSELVAERAESVQTERESE